MSAVPPTPRVKLRTASRSVPSARSADPDGSTVVEAEPNMRLSRAIMVMLLLHVVAVGGILAFSLIKERGINHAAADSNGTAVEAEDSNIPSTKNGPSDVSRDKPDSTGPRAGSHASQQAETLAVANPPSGASEAVDRIEGNQGNTSVTSSASVPKNTHLPLDSGKTYVVGKGESPYTIAQKLKVNYDALLRLNQIDDPKKLKPGQKLRVPAPLPAKSKTK